MSRLAFAIAELGAVLSDAWHDADLGARLRSWWAVVTGQVSLDDRYTLAK